MVEQIIYSNKSKYDLLIEKFNKGGVDSLQIISDFDRTLTKAFSEGKFRGSLISILYQEGYLSEEYQQKAQGLFELYHPIEIDETISLAERVKAMETRWIKHKELLIKEKLTKQDIYNAMKSQNVDLRDGSNVFFDYIDTYGIPLIILSAGGLGILSIQKYLENNNIVSSYIYIIGNDFIRDEKDVAIDYKRPIIHTLNKSERIINDKIINDKIQNRKNIILLGDSIGDTDMADGIIYNNIIKIGFLNKDIDTHLENYKNNFDVIILGDGSMNCVNSILNDIVNNV